MGVMGGTAPSLLSNYLVTTDSQGLASTELRFGGAAGTSYVVAQASNAAVSLIAVASSADS